MFSTGKIVRYVGPKTNSLAAGDTFLLQGYDDEDGWLLARLSDDVDLEALMDSLHSDVEISDSILTKYFVLK